VTSHGLDGQDSIPCYSSDTSGRRCVETTVFYLTGPGGSFCGDKAATLIRKVTGSAKCRSFLPSRNRAPS
jgi:hypothetical protein